MVHSITMECNILTMPMSGILLGSRSGCVSEINYWISPNPRLCTIIGDYNHQKPYKIGD
jgi:hypothetical protein